jgi:hypothetical protein
VLSLVTIILFYFILPIKGALSTDVSTDVFVLALYAEYIITDVFRRHLFPGNHEPQKDLSLLVPWPSLTPSGSPLPFTLRHNSQRFIHPAVLLLMDSRVSFWSHGGESPLGFCTMNSTLHLDASALYLLCSPRFVSRFLTFTFSCFLLRQGMSSRRMISRGS